MNGKKLYKIKNGAMITGVCNGLAAYFDVDVSLMRLAVVVITCFTGIGIIPYIAAAVILPELNDSPYGNTVNSNYNNTNNSQGGGSFVDAEQSRESRNENGKDII